MEKYILDDIVSDTSNHGKFISFYEDLNEAISDNFDEGKLLQMKEVLLFAFPSEKSQKEIESYDKLKLIYEYSKLI